MGSYPPGSSSSLRINRLPAVLTGTFWHGSSRKVLSECPGTGEAASKSLSGVLRSSASSTSRHMDLPEELLQDIFVQLDFARLCRLERICRRWKAILQTNFVRRNMIVYLPIHKTRSAFPFESFQKALPQVQNVALIGGSARHDSCSDDVDTILELVLYKAAPYGRLVVQNIHTGPLGFDDFDAGFGTVELRNVTFAGDTILKCASTVSDDDDPDDRLARVRGIVNDDLLDFAVVGPYVLYDGPLDEAGKAAAFRKMTTDNLPPLPAVDMVTLRGTLEEFEETVVRQLISELLSLFQPEFQLLPGQDLTKLDYGTFSSLVCWLLFAWNGIPLGDGDESESEDDEDDINYYQDDSAEEYTDDDDDDDGSDDGEED